MIGLVVVSHSHALAQAAVGLAMEMVDGDLSPRVEIAAGLDETTFGTDAVAVSAAIERADSPDGILVLVDLGSAVLSTEMALEFLDPDIAHRVLVSPAPLVEGLVAAVVTASSGGSLEDTAREARGGLAGKLDHLGFEASSAAPSDAPSAAGPELRETVTITNPQGLHARPAATLVSLLRSVTGSVQVRNATTGKGPVDARSLTRVATLGLTKGHQMEVIAEDPRALEIVRKAAADRFGEVESAPTATALPDSAATGTEIVIAPAVVRRSRIDLSAYTAGSPAQESDRFGAALEAVDTRLEALTAGPQGAVFAAQQALAHDEEVLTGVRSRIGAGVAAPAAVDAEFASAAAEFDQLRDPYLRDRGADVRSVSVMIQRSLAGIEEPAATTTEHVLVVDELDAATAAALDSAATPAVVTLRGGATGHGVIVAAARGIAVITGHPEAGDVRDGQLLAVDPQAGTLTIDPDANELSVLRQSAQTRVAELTAVRAHATEPAITTGGQRILVEANVASLADAARGAREGAEGSGLVRTEILFADSVDAPSAQEQADQFVRIGHALGGTITIRTWDAGGDKPLPFIPQSPEANPFLGERGLRAMRRVPEIFAEQLRAIAMAAAQIDVRILLPMVTEPGEISWAREQLALIEGASKIPVGMMVEVPAAAIRAADFAGLVDFVSIGTNDLTQYATAADRGNALVSGLARPGHPAVLDLIEQTARALPAIPIAVCGDLASEPKLTAELVRRGVTELSVRPPLVGLVKAAVRRV
ncbi:dihydroxyacetone kinase phosphoryl donor subunit DhaM [Calidifontibacter terrae]